tara:strand:+ start:62034 stop:62495 length:462 start_codon:yes stop_codon:yes gene_type:complete
MIVYRISKGKYKEDLSGTGAELYGGRWNNKGVKMLYTASSIALAMSEVAVHVPYGILPQDYFVISIEIPDSSFESLDMSLLKGIDWEQIPHGFETQTIGDDFINKGTYLALKVPSVVVPGDYNFILNPHHENYDKVKVVDVQPFSFDKRMFGL